MTMHTETNGKVLLRIGPRGFCAGVVRAVDIVELALEAYGAPVYVHHEIVHNTYVVEQLRRRGAIFVESIEDVPHGAVLVFSAHGVPPTVRDEAKARALKVIDATCPLVTKGHLEALKFAREKRTIILIAHRNHPEIVGTSGAAPDRTIVWDSGAALDALDDEWLSGVSRVGLTAGASATEVLVEQVSERLAEFGFTDQRDLDLIREDVRFTLPPELATIAPAPRR